jgi:DNA processing protein
MKIGFSRFKKCLKHFRTIEEVFNASSISLKQVLDEKIVDDFILFRSSFKYEDIIKDLRRKNIVFISIEDTLFPGSLRNICDPPFGLFVKGDVNLLSNPVILGIVGTRKVTSYGRQVTTFFSSQLAKNGAVIVSGMAMGVDGIAHQGCIDSRGKTIAVLGCGVDIMYPAINRLLYQSILSSGGAIISEYPPGTVPKPFTFIHRNRIISGLSRGVFIVEGSLSSGSMITANFALEQGKDVFAVPMPLLSPVSAGPNSLLKQGAKLVLDPEDILSEYGIDGSTSLSNITNDLSHDERQMYSFLELESCTIQTLISKSKKNISYVLQIISQMEMKGIVSKNREGKYERLISPQSV